MRIEGLKPVQVIKRPAYIGKSAGKAGTPENSDNFLSKVRFSDVLKNLREAGNVKFSNHALKRMSQRDIRIEAADLQKLNNAVKSAAGKGSRDSLVFMQTKSNKSVAFVVNIPNKTVVTALDKAEAAGHTFTNIDSALIL